VKRKYQIRGVSCTGCVERVKQTLESHPSIEKAEILLTSKGITLITMKKALSIVELQSQLDELNGYTIVETD